MRPELKQVRRLKLKRRDLLKLAPLAGAGAVGGVLLASGKRAHAEVRKGTCRFCLMHCGYEAKVVDGHLERVDGDLASKTRGFLCMHGWALREVVNSADRLRLPLMRHHDAFVELTWPDALGELAARLQKVKAEHGPQALAILTGWPLVRHPLVRWIHRFARAFGSPNVGTVASLCEASARMGQALTAGSKYSAELRRARTLVLWGANPSVSAPPMAPLIQRRAEEGGLIVVDPVKNAAAKSASEHLAVRPGTDGALALAMANVVLSEGLFDPKWVEENVHGFEEFKAYAARYGAEEVAQLTSVPRDQLVRVARRLATEKPTRIWPGLGVEHHENGVQTVRAIAALEALCGRWEHGANDPSVLTPPERDYKHQPLPALYRMTTPEPVPPPLEVKPLGYHEFPLFEVYNREAQGNLLADAVLDGKPYPVRALMLIASNYLVTGPDSVRIQQAADKLDVLTVVAPFLTRSAQRADFVLPATTFAEGIAVEGDEGAISSHGVVDPVGQAWPDWKVLFELARALGLGRYFPWKTIDEAEKVPRVPWMIDEKHQPKPLAETPDAPTFGTPTGKVELQSTVLETFGFPALPEWKAPSDQPGGDFPLRLVTGPRTRAYINTQFRNVPSVRAKQPQPVALVHPGAGAKAGLADGGQVAIVTPRGKLVMTVRLTDEVHPEVVVLPAGWEEHNPNLVLPPGRFDPISGFPAFRSGVCRVEKA